MDLGRQLQEQLRLVEWIDRHLKVALPINQRSYPSIGCFDVAIEHHAAMLLLAQSELYGSMFSLVRVAFESLGRGLWLRHCASDKDLAAFGKGKLEIPFGTLIERVEAAVGVSGGPLSRLKDGSWSLMNSLTHTGIEQVRARHSATATGGNYDPNSVSSALNLAGTFALLAASELASYAGDPDLVKLVLKRAGDYSGKQP